MNNNMPGENDKNNAIKCKYTPFHTGNNKYTSAAISLATEAPLLV